MTETSEQAPCLPVVSVEPWQRPPRAVVTWLLALAALAALTAALLYVVLPADVMPPLTPGAPRIPGWEHRYLQAAAVGILGVALAATAFVHNAVRRRAYADAEMFAAHR